MHLVESSQGVITVVTVSKPRKKVYRVKLPLSQKGKEMQVR